MSQSKTINCERVSTRKTVLIAAGTSRHPKNLPDLPYGNCPDCGERDEIARSYVFNDAGKCFVWHGCWNCRGEWKSPVPERLKDGSVNE